jgi:pseudaminic acid cytidylyltransferase
VRRITAPSPDRDGERTHLAVIPARGGSKRIPGKNIRPFLGKPIISYSIEVALEVGLFDEVMVSTDSDVIAGISTQCGATVPFSRSPENADDFATLADVLLEVLARYDRDDRAFDTVCCLLPTAPLIQPSWLINAYALLEGEQCTAVCPVVPYSYPIWRSFRIDTDHTLRMNWPEYVSSRSQDLPFAYHDSGSFYVIDVPALQQERTLFTDKCAPLLLSESEVQDIDSEADWGLAELKFQLMKKA